MGGNTGCCQGKEPKNHCYSKWQGARGMNKNSKDQSRRSGNVMERDRKRKYAETEDWNSDSFSWWNMALWEKSPSSGDPKKEVQETWRVKETKQNLWGWGDPEFNKNGPRFEEVIGKLWEPSGTENLGGKIKLSKHLGWEGMRPFEWSVDAIKRGGRLSYQKGRGWKIKKASSFKLGRLNRLCLGGWCVFVHFWGKKEMDHRGCSGAKHPAHEVWGTANSRGFT